MPQSLLSATISFNTAFTAARLAGQSIVNLYNVYRKKHTQALLRDKIFTHQVVPQQYAFFFVAKLWSLSKSKHPK